MAPPANVPLTTTRGRRKIGGVSRKFQELGKPRSAWVEVASDGDTITIAPDPEAPKVGFSEADYPGRPLAAEEIAEEFGDIPVDRNP